MRSAIRRDPGVSTIRILKWTIITGIYCLAAMLMIPIGVYTMPDLESAWYPPITQQEINNVHFKADDPHYLLWEWSFIKQRKAYPEYITFMAYSVNDPTLRYAVDSYIGWDCKTNPRSDRTSLPRAKPYTKQVCVKLPDSLAGSPDVRVDGVFDFKVGHNFYTVPVKIPSQSIEGIPAPLAAPR